MRPTPSCWPRRVELMVRGFVFAARAEEVAANRDALCAELRTMLDRGLRHDQPDAHRDAAAPRASMRSPTGRRSTSSSSAAASPASEWRSTPRPAASSVALLERDDLASGTSRWSSKLAHGGLRYLAKGDVGVAWESAVERAILVDRTAPHLVRALPQILPLQRDISRGTGAH